MKPSSLATAPSSTRVSSSRHHAGHVCVFCDCYYFIRRDIRLNYDLKVGLFLHRFKDATTRHRHKSKFQKGYVTSYNVKITALNQSLFRLQIVSNILRVLWFYPTIRLILKQKVSGKLSPLWLLSIRTLTLVQQSLSVDLFEEAVIRLRGSGLHFNPG